MTLKIDFQLHRFWWINAWFYSFRTEQGEPGVSQGCLAIRPLLWVWVHHLYHKILC